MEEKFYTIQETRDLKELFRIVDDQRQQINILKPSRPELWPTIQEKLRADWTYDSNAIEGSTLTRGETLFFLREGLTVEGKPFKDFLDARNHAEAIDFLRQVIKDERPISQGLIKDINALLLAGITHTEAVDIAGRKIRKPASPGQYKRQPNHVLQLDGTIHYYTDPLRVPDEMEMLCRWIKENIENKHPLIVGTVAHYNMVRIHAFDDGNGRGARILMNLILIKKRYAPAIIRMKDRRQYLEALSRA
ncbi:MAG: Fic family protein, partial [Deltaproteobacteria bacterium]|nr:Fic family protein [Deltaproteobacteria bacterium]